MTSGAKADGRFGEQDFVYSAAEDVYRCPAGEKLTMVLRTKRRQNATPLLDDGMPTLPAQVSCTTGGERRITRSEHGHLLEAVRGVSMPIHKRYASVVDVSIPRDTEDADRGEPLSDEALAEGRDRNGPARSHLQYSRRS